MRPSGQALSPVIVIDRSSSVPLHKQVYDGYRAGILRGDLRPGQAVTSTRELAVELGLSRFPVLHAYAQLAAEGYFEASTGSGTFIARSIPERLMSVDAPCGSVTRLLSGPRQAARRMEAYRRYESPGTRGLGAFGVHQPAFEEFPFQAWSSLVARHSRNPRASAIHHVNPLGLERFREEICGYLRTARAVNCEPGQIMVVSGSQQAIDITARVLLDPGNRVWVEEPGYSLGRTALIAAGCRLVPIPVDSEGMDVPYAMRHHSGARAAFVTPSHQYPLGSTMSATRRLQLLNWAQRRGAWIVEDDYDSEYRYGVSPIASLQGLDANGRVIYIGTFSKILLPSLRIGYIVIPPDLVDRFAAVRFAMDIFPPYLFQEVLTDFMRLGHFARHIRRMRNLYGERRAVLVESLRVEFGNLLEVHGAEAGMHLAVMLPEGWRDREIAAAAARERLWLWPLSPCYMGERPRPGLVLGFGSVAAQEVPRAARKLRSILEPSAFSRQLPAGLTDHGLLKPGIQPHPVIH
jgi:GntR family transcriptional regulator / MocR family aminotransferase